MNQGQLIEIHNANNRITSVSDLNNSFLEIAKAQPAPIDIPSKLEFKNQSILVKFAGHTAEAVPRLVKTLDGDFAYEYVFIVQHRDMDGDREVEVWRFYFLSGGRLTESLADQNPICDFDNNYVAKILCGRVLSGMLNSDLFNMRPKQKG
jgi:hypothetical protein